MRKRGFTLIETIYSCVLLSLVTLFILNLYPSSFLAIKRGESTMQAEMLAQTVLEDIKSRNFANLNQIQPTDYAAAIYGGIQYTPTVSIGNYTDPTGASVNASLLQVAVVQISWTYQNNNHVLSHEMFLANVTR